VIDTTHGSADELPTATGTFHHPTIIRVNVSGTVTQYLTPGYSGTPIVKGPTVDRADSSGLLYGAMGFRNGGDHWWAGQTSSTVQVMGSIFAKRNVAGGASYPRGGDGTHCGPLGYADCWTWSGSAHLDFERIHVGPTLTRTPDSTVGALVTLTAGMDSTEIDGKSVDMSELHFVWVPDVPETNDTLTCKSVSGRTCVHELVEAGMMVVSAFVNGEWQMKAMHVSVTCGDREDDLLNTEFMRDLIKTLWERSIYSPITPQNQRREQGAWIFQNADLSFSYDFLDPGKYAPSFCGINGPRELPTIPAGARLIWFIHTHPSFTGELAVACGQMKVFPSGEPAWLDSQHVIPRYPIYGGTPSDPDHQLYSWLEARVPSGFPLFAAYMVDPTGVTKFNYVFDNDQEWPRCEY
jgi:hypothetical protein